MRDTGRAARGEGGFSLVEVIAALVVLGIVATAAAYFFIAGTRTSTHLQRTQNAVAVANEAMEMAFAMEPRDSLAVTGVTNLAVGRTQAEVNAAWTAATALGVEGLAETYPVWDPTALATTADALPITFERTYSDQTYTVYLLVGTCFRYANNAGTDEECTRLPAFGTDPGDNPAGISSQVARMLRVIAIVTWDAEIGECPGDVCVYQLSGLVDRNQDIRWDTSLAPVAVDDSAPLDRLATGSNSIDINVLLNDTYSRLASYPVRIETAPVAGCGNASADPSTGTVTYTYTTPSPSSGICTFTYSLKDGQGTVSRNEGTVSISVLPIAQDDVANVISGVRAPIAVTANDNGTYAALTVTTAPSHGTATVSGLNVLYTSAEDYVGDDTLAYQYTDPSGQVATAEVTIHVGSFPVQDWAVPVAGRPVGPEVWTSVEEKIMTGIPTPSDYVINVVGARPTAGILEVGPSATPATATTGTDINYSPPAATSGTYSFQYTLTRIATGWTSQPKTVTLIVSPLPVLTAVADTLGKFTDNGTRTVTIGANDTPSGYPAATVQVSFTGPVYAGTSNACGEIRAGDQSAAYLEAGQLRVRMPNISTDRACTFTYTLIGKGSMAGMTSGPVLVTYTVDG